MDLTPSHPTADSLVHLGIPGQSPTKRGGGNESSLANVLWRRKGILIFTTLIGLAGGYFHFTKQPETYAARSVISVYQPVVSNATGSAVETLVDTAPGVAQIQAEMTSDEVLFSAIEMGQLTTFEGVPQDVGALAGWIRGGIDFIVPKDSAARNTSIVSVVFECQDALLSTSVVNAVVEAYEKHLGGRHKETVDNVVGFFREARDTLLPQLNELEKQYADFRSDAPLEWSSDGEAVNPFRQDALTIEESLQKARSESRQIETKLRLIQDATRDQTSAVLAMRDLQFMLDDVKMIDSADSAVEVSREVDPEVLIKEQLVPKVIQSDMLKQQFGENHPVRKQLEEEIESTRRALADLDRTKQEKSTDATLFSTRREEEAYNLLKSYINGLKRKKELLSEDAKELETRLADTRARAHNMMKFENENTSFLRRIKRLQDMLDSFDSQLEKASLPLLNPGLEVAVLHRSGLGSLTGPLLSQSLVMGLLTGIALGCLLGWLVDWSERTYRSPDEITGTLGIPVLANLPMMLLNLPKGNKKGRKGKDVEAVDTGTEVIAPSISVVHDPHAPTSEAIRGIRTRLLCKRNEQADFQVIQITSALPGDGKSTIAGNLAASIARAHKRVIIVDADLRRPTQHSLFGKPSPSSGLGLTSVLNHEVSLADAIQVTGVEGLDLLTTGPMPNNPAEALMLPEFAGVIDDLRTEYDLIIIDSPPLLACTDASNISSQVDGVLFVMRIGRNCKPSSQKAVQLLKNLQVNTIGVVVNAIGDTAYSATYASAASSYGGDYSYGYGYGYGYGHSASDEYLGASKSRTVTVRGRKAQLELSLNSDADKN